VLGPVAAIDVFGTVTALGTTEIGGSYGTAINDADAVVGYFSPVDATIHAGLFRHGRPTKDLGSLGGPISAAFAVKDNGVIVGYSTLADGSTAHAASFSSENAPLDLGTLGGPISAALAVNRFNSAVGFSTLSDNISIHATLFSRHAPALDLGSLGGPLSLATAINGRGDIVGSSLLSDGVTTHAAAFTPGGAPTDLGALAGDTTSAASGINSASCVVGISSSQTQRGVLWTKSRGAWTILDLNSLIEKGSWTIDSAIAINDRAIVPPPVSSRMASNTRCSSTSAIRWIPSASRRRPIRLRGTEMQQKDLERDGNEDSLKSCWWDHLINSRWRQF
jgi:probable HAF family extracellular repeat protein